MEEKILSKKEIEENIEKNKKALDGKFNKDEETKFYQDIKGDVIEQKIIGKADVKYHRTQIKEQCTMIIQSVKIDVKDGSKKYLSQDAISCTPDKTTLLGVFHLALWGAHIGNWNTLGSQDLPDSKIFEAAKSVYTTIVDTLLCFKDTCDDSHLHWLFNENKGLLLNRLKLIDDLKILEHKCDNNNVKRLINKLLNHLNKFSLNIAYDTEYQQYHNNKALNRHLISMQFTVKLNSCYYNFYFFNFKVGGVFNFQYFLQWVLAFLESRLKYSISTLKNTRDTYKIVRGRAIPITASQYLPLSLIAHNGKADLSHFKDFKKLYCKQMLTDLQGTSISLKPTRITINLLRATKCRSKNSFKCLISFRDTMPYAVGNKSLAKIGSNTTFGKLDVQKHYGKPIPYDNMTKFAYEDIEKFVEYGGRDTMTVLDICDGYFDANQKLPVTIGSDTVDKFVDYFCNINGIKRSDRKTYEFIYRGLEKCNSNNLVKIDGEVKAIVQYDYKSHLFRQAHDFANYSFVGGTNQCYISGPAGLNRNLKDNLQDYIDQQYDYDLKNAYPTFLAAIPMIDYNIEPTLINNLDPAQVCSQMSKYREFSLDQALIDFDFDKVDDKYKFYKHIPFIPQKVNNSVVFTTRGERVYVGGAELYRAAQIGAITKVHSYYKIPILEDVNGVCKFAFRDYVIHCINERAKAKAEFGKGSQEETYWKLMINSLYGKLAQGLKGSKVAIYDYNGVTREELKICKVTNSLYATQTTSLCRLVLHDTIARLFASGTNVFTVTTDGFLCDNGDVNFINNILNEDITQRFHHTIQQTRLALTDGNDFNYYELKHLNNGSLILGTRGCIPTNKEGNFAKMGYKGTQDENDNPKKLIKNVIDNNFVMQDQFKKFTTTGEMILKNKIYDARIIEKTMILDYDFKRNILSDKVDNVTFTLDGKIFTVPLFHTKPYEKAEDFISNKTRVNNYHKEMKKAVRSSIENIEEFTAKSELLDNIKKKGATRYVGKNVKTTQLNTFLYHVFAGDDKVSKVVVRYLTKLNATKLAEFLNDMEYTDYKYTNINVRKLKHRSKDDSKYKGLDFPKEIEDMILNKLLENN